MLQVTVVNQSNEKLQVISLKICRKIFCKRGSWIRKYRAAGWCIRWRVAGRRWATASVQCWPASASCRGSCTHRRSQPTSTSEVGRWFPRSRAPRTTTRSFCAPSITASSHQGCSGAGTRWNAVPANTLESERRSGKYRWPHVERQHWSVPANDVVLVRLTLDQFFSGPNCSQTRDSASKISKKFPGVTPGPPQRGGGAATPSCTHPQHGYTPCAGAQAPPLLGLRSRKPFPKSKFTTNTPASNQ